MLSNTKMMMRGLKVVTHTIMGWEMPIINHDRFILEEKIIPYFVNNEEFRKVLFVGCGSYTKHYEKWFKRQEYWTIDINPMKKIYGAKRHIVGSISDLNVYFQKNYLDLIICNGVFGWGLNERDEVEKAFAACFDSLQKDGVIIIGWDDLPERKPFPLETCESLSKFQPYFFPPLSTTKYENSEDEGEPHRYNFYVKRV
ncbi:class I SAM-dependent methyltransferase [Aetokthonos hydrillicola Thurmond2011]|jgi:SAM-dependent methyltransferase|uniref:Class I SAM-dependent methyltransferase n=1 Tax=Aetokthonos hydrillicola Thurmond2011 TaxID=2712845 RepID=A0AAP5MC52_9CYAN|nr:methyltransferase domain-containing protein [Aetokthonos hydrillicola]MBO3459916.1 methyltransferase domain-containing protein [Aetokthonos hydrillicola CCALA 1050]MBW4584033.1 class I SAM-dependent methyltransferase [Aetokthonos hydrillicola CCALA 1050]MDR9898772.1 class I SAM-dependent methyltransferase [Aetokthonos hydrillicola Thurmond2011]